MKIAGHVTWGLLLLALAGCESSFSDDAKDKKDDQAMDQAKERKKIPWGEVVAGLQTRIWIDNDRTTFPLGEKIVVRFALRNVGDQNQTVLVRGFWPNHRVDVFKGNAEAQLTKEGSDVRKLFSMGGTEEKTSPRIVKPKEVVESYRTIELNKLYDLTEPGEYRVRIIYQDSKPVVSNDLVFTIK